MRSPADSRLPRLAGWGGTLRCAPDLMPLAGVVFLMLVFLSVDGSALGGPLLPASRTAVVVNPDSSVVLGVDRWGNVYLSPSPEPVPLRRLPVVLDSLFATRAPEEDRTVYLVAGRSTEYGRILPALDAARAAGVRRVGALVWRSREAPLLPRPSRRGPGADRP